MPTARREPGGASVVRSQVMLFRHARCTVQVPQCAAARMVQRGVIRSNVPLTASSVRKGVGYGADGARGTAQALGAGTVLMAPFSWPPVVVDGTERPFPQVHGHMSSASLRLKCSSRCAALCTTFRAQSSLSASCSASFSRHGTSLRRRRSITVYRTMAADTEML